MNRKITIALLLCLLLSLTIAAHAASKSPADPDFSASGTNIACLQSELIKRGSLDGEADGVFGEQTRFALETWCSANGVVLSEHTVDSLLVLMQQQNNLTTPDQLMADKTSVYLVQRNLARWGFLDSDVDGKFGAGTRSALKLFMDYAGSDMAAILQKREEEAAKLRAEGGAVSADEMPLVMDEPLVNSDNVSTDGDLTKDWFDFIVSEYTPHFDTIARGSGKADVLRVQKRLHTLGYLAAGIDGNYGQNTERVVKYFQKRNNLPETGDCDSDTLLALFSEDARKSDQYVSPYMARVSTSKNQVRIYAWTGDGYNEEVKKFVCTTGARGTPTAKGTFQAVGQVAEWYYMPNSSVWVRYAFKIKGNYFFHSLLYGYKGDPTPSSSSVRNLGTNASHGCIRLKLEDVKWIYNNCTPGMTVIIE